ncbi:hypothetical protein V6N13_140364 [Hibiscus sabdariffa]
MHCFPPSEITFFIGFVFSFSLTQALRLKAYSAKHDFILVSESNNKNRPLARKLQSFVKTDVLVGAIGLMVGKFFNFPTKADASPTMVE